MSRLRRGGDVLTLVAVLVVLAVASAFFAARGGPATADDNPRYSANSARPSGYKGLFLLMERSGVDVRKFEREPKDWPADVPVLVSAEPFHTETWDDKETRDALRWVEGGDRALVLLGDAAALTKKLGLSRLNTARRGDATLFPLQPVAFVAGVDGLHLPGRQRFTRTPPGAVPLFADGNGPAVLVLRRGRGTIVAVSDPRAGVNAHLARDDNARFFLQLARTYGVTSGGARPRVAFDEFHQGYYDGASFWTAVGRPGRLVAGQLAALALLIAYSASRRFGLPRPLPEAQRVSSEYVASLADLYRRAGAGDAALDGVFRSFRRDLCRAVGVPFDAPTEEVVAQATRTLAAASEETKERLRRAVNDCEARIASGKVADAELVPLARELAALRKDLNLGGQPQDG